MQHAACINRHAGVHHRALSAHGVWVSARRSGHDIERLHMTHFPGMFNAEVDDLADPISKNMDARSDNKGIETEGIEVRILLAWSRKGLVVHRGGNGAMPTPWAELRLRLRGAMMQVGTLASGTRVLFVGNERTSSLMVYDLTDPAAPVFQSISLTGNTTSGVGSTFTDAMLTVRPDPVTLPRVQSAASHVTRAVDPPSHPADARHRALGGA